ncbi:MAG: immunoglobulin domain-containing protein [Verrucomicrobia bacterium]|nr:immunoglobulin domain-containing protein [Verrucomicrobiota bacterium]
MRINNLLATLGLGLPFVFGIGISSSTAADGPPVIVLQPQSQSVSFGSRVSFSVTADGTGPLSYQWRKDGVAIPGAVSSTYALANVQSTDQARYTVVVENQFGRILSSEAILTVIDLGQPIRLVNPTELGGRFSVSFPTDFGKLYVLEKKDALAEAEWMPTVALTGDGRVRTLSEARRSPSQRFYRLAVTVLGDPTKAIYGRDNRVDLYDEPLQRRRTWASAVCGIVSTEELTANADGTFTLRVGSFNASIQAKYGSALCNDEPFRNQPLAPFCTAWLIGPDLVATAGHCLLGSPDNLPSFRFVFGFVAVNANSAVTRFDAQQVYTGRVVERYPQSSSADDYAIIRLDRPVQLAGVRPLAVRQTGRISTGSQVGVIGHPWGLPVKIAFGEDAIVTALGPSPNVFYATLDTYEGNSGSPVFNADTGDVEGILITGRDDFEVAAGCTRSIRYTDLQARKVEGVFEITKIPRLLELIAERPNQPPTISTIADQSANEDSPITVTFTINDDRTPIGNLNLTYSSSNPTLLPEPNITAAGTGTDRTVTLRPANDEYGETRITVTVTDGDGASVRGSFRFTVAQVNDQPTLATIPDMEIYVGTLQDVTLTGITYGPANENQTITLKAASSDRTLIPDPTVTYTSPNTQGKLTLAPASNRTGKATITVTVQDNGGNANGGQDTITRTFNVAVIVPPPVQITHQGPVEYAAGGTVQITNRFAWTGTMLSLLWRPQLPGGWQLQSTDSIGAGTVEVNPSRTAILWIGALPPSPIQMRYTVQVPATATGTQQIRGEVEYQLQGTVNPQTAFATPNPLELRPPPSTPPTISSISDQTIKVNTSTAAIPFTVNDAETTADQLQMFKTSSNTTLVPEANILFGGGGANRTVTITPAANQTGNARITLTVRDTEGLTAASAFQVTVTPGEPPRIITPPQSQTVNVGATVTFSVVASGTGPLTYQWRKNDQNIPGATLVSYTIASAQNSDAGNYDVVVRNSAGSVTSQSATLTVPPPLTGSFQIVPQKLDFGNVVLGQVSPLRFQLINPTAGTVTGTASIAGASPSDPVDAATKLLLHMDGPDGSTSFIDSSPSPKTVNRSGNNTNVEIDTSESKFGGASALFHGRDDGLTIPDSDDWHMPGDMTIDFWVKFTGLPTQRIIMQRESGDAYWGIGYENENYLQYFIRNGGGSIGVHVVRWFPQVATWYHLAFVRSGDTHTFYINGTRLGQSTVSTSRPNNYNGQLFIGRNGDGVDWVSGWMDEVRISKGVARWTSDFTPPTRAYGQVFEPAAPFSIVSGSPFNLAPGQTGIVTIGFSPDRVGTFATNVVFATSLGSITNSVSGIGTIEGGPPPAVPPQPVFQILPQNLDFGNVVIGQVSPLRFQLVNPTTDTVTGTANIAGASASVPVDAATKLLLHMDGPGGSTSILDSSPSPKTVTRFGNAQIDTSESKFGGASALFHGPDDYLTIPDSDDWHMPGDMTVDLWVRFTGIPAVQVFVMQYESADNYWGIYLLQGQLRYFIRNGGYIPVHTVDWFPQIETWYHVAFVRNGNSHTFFINGTRLGQSTVSDSRPNNYAGQLFIGKNGIGNDWLTGWMEELRISKDVARWTSNFAPPTRAYGQVFETAAPFRVVNGSPFSVAPGQVDFVTIAFSPFQEGTFATNVVFATSQGFHVNSVSGSGTTNDGPTPSVIVAAVDPEASETGSNTGAFIVSRSGPITGPLEVSFLVGGTAIGGTDYQSLGTSITIPAGAASANLVVSPVIDSALEGGETVTVTLLQRSGYAIGVPSSATVAISDGPVGAFEIVPPRLDFGNVVVGLTSPLSFQLINKTAGTVTGTAAIAGASSSVPVDAATKLLLHMDGPGGSTSILDSSPSPKTVTRFGNAQIDASQSKFGGASALFHGPDDYLTIPDSDDWHMPGDMTVDFWVRFTSLSQPQVFVMQYESSDYYWGIILLENQLRYFIRNNGYIPIHAVPWPALQTNTWYHIAFVRSGDTHTFYVNGTRLGQSTVSTDRPNNYAGQLFIGKNGIGNDWLTGWMEELRISKDVARWTSDFTPPTRAYGQPLETAATPFKVVSGSPFNLAPGQVGFVSVAFSPFQIGTFATNVVFATSQGFFANSVSGIGR